MSNTRLDVETLGGGRIVLPPALTGSAGKEGREGSPYKPKKMTHVSVKVVNSTVRMFSTVLTPFLCKNMEFLEGVNISHLHY